ncbi:hypothetical protein GIB67_002419 [Kingdonia uniflora]|uniref:Neprosin PEP catalytic domain-containing protein n=1 Tax=Kingdonia uniflora TaxID=39325 RepID=A0A7J7MPD9_9MAGN|nr:hypothetical protein GIB67_002419 [Kingdonia uniflora]
MGSITLIVYLLCFLVRFHRVQGELSISEEEHLEFDNQLNVLNKPPLKTVVGEAGDVFDCVDIHKQPAFDHPLLKNHSVQMAPTSMPEGLIAKSLTASKELRPVQETVDCPHGTVPIRRTRKEDLKRAKSINTVSHAQRSISPHPKTSTLTTKYPGQHRAIVRTKLSNRMYHGAYGIMNTLNPNVEREQWSSAQIWVENAAGGQLDTIQVGWKVDPKLFGDTRTRFFIYWESNADFAEPKGCYNLLCSGFVQTNRENPVGATYAPTSKYGGQQYTVSFYIFQDGITKDWWLINRDLKNPIIYGYWPKSLFPSLTQGANYVGWGAVTQAASSGFSPQMGNGYFADGHYDHSGYFSNILVMNESYDAEEIKRDILEIVRDAPKCFNAKLYPYRQDVGNSIMYGGPGGACGV